MYDKAAVQRRKIETGGPYCGPACRYLNKTGDLIFHCDRYDKDLRDFPVNDDDLGKRYHVLRCRKCVLTEIRII